MRILLVLAALVGSALPASANDGFGFLSAEGLTFDQTEAVEMVEENLFIIIDKVTVTMSSATPPPRT